MQNNYMKSTLLLFIAGGMILLSSCTKKYTTINYITPPDTVSHISKVNLDGDTVIFNKNYEVSFSNAISINNTIILNPSNAINGCASILFCNASDIGDVLTFISMGNSTVIFATGGNSLASTDADKPWIITVTFYKNGTGQGDIFLVSSQNP